MFGLFKSKSVNFGALIKERDKVVVLLQADLASSLDTLSFLGSWQKEFKRVIVKTDEYRVRFWQSLLKEDNLEVKSQLNPEDKEKAIVLDFDGNKADVQKFKESLILSSNQQLCNFSFSSWEPVLASFSKLFSLKLQSKQVVDTPKDFGNSQGLILVDLAFDKKIKRLQEQHDIVATKGDPRLQEKDFLEVYNLALSAKKIVCFNQERKKMWELLGFEPTLIEKNQDYAQIL